VNSVKSSFFPACDIFFENSGSSINLSIASAIAFGDRGSTRSPVSSSLIISGIPPALVAITGFPTAIASSIARPNGSFIEGSINTSIAEYIFSISFLSPANITLSKTPKSFAKSSRESLSGPSPAIIRRMFFLFFESIERASISSKTPFERVSLAAVPMIYSSGLSPNSAFISLVSVGLNLSISIPL